MDEQYCVMDENWGKMVHFIVTEETSSERDMWEMGGSVSKFLCLESTERTDQSRVGPWPFENSHMVLTSQMVLWLRLTKAYIWITLCKCSMWKPWSHQQLECKFSISYKKKKQLDWVKSVTSIPCLGLAPPNPLHTFFF